MNTKQLIANAILVIVVSFNASACTFGAKTESQSGNVKTENRNLKDFTEVLSQGSVDVKIKQAETFEVKVEAEETIISKITTTIEGNTLVVSIENNFSFSSPKNATVYVSMPKLNGLNTYGSGNITCESKLPADNFTVATYGSGDIVALIDGKNATIQTLGSGDIKIMGSFNDVEASTNGSGDINGKIDCATINFQINGSGDIKLTGKGTNLNAQINGSGDVNCTDFSVVNGEVSIHGSGDCQINVSDKIVANTFGSGDVFYSGNPSIVRVSSDGSGQVQKK